MFEKVLLYEEDTYRHNHIHVVYQRLLNRYLCYLNFQSGVVR